MRFLLFLSVLTILSATTQARDYDYCSKPLCRPGYLHIACGHNWRFSKACPPNARMVDLRKHIPEILNLHNEKRNEVAGGNLKRYQPAARMATMVWDEELASLAALNVKQCRMAHDKCRNTEMFKYAGQNLAQINYYGQTFTDDALIQSSIEGWFDEHKYANMYIIDDYPESYSGPPIGHFTAMVIDRNTHVGCAASRFQTGGYEHFLFACDYALTNLLGEPIYESSSLPASGCQSGINKFYKNLCSANESYEFYY